MDGDFKTAITRDTFQPLKHFSRVLRQQGRVDLDADWNELVDILLHYQRSFTTDVIGPHAGTGMRITQRPQPRPPTPEDDADEKRKKGKSKKPPQPQPIDVSFQFQVGTGRYYVDGILSESDRDNYYFTMLSDDRPQKNEKEPYQYLFYLDVWEREVTYLEDDSIREVALGGPDTATRAQVIWRVKVKNIKNIKGSDNLLPTNERYANTGPDGTFNIAAFGNDWTTHVRAYAPDFVDTDDQPRTEGPARMKARTLPPEEQSTSPCITPPSAQYRGPENQLYRVEIHDPGYAYQDQPPAKGGGGAAEARGKARSADGGPLPQATFKWSRENGSVVFPIVGDVPAGTNITVTVESLGNDDSHSALHMDQWVEIIDAEEIIEGEPGPLFQVTNIDYSTMQVTLTATSTDGYQPDNDDVGRARHRYLRRWDYQEGDPSQNDAIHLAPTGAAKLIENRWLLLEDGVQILFHSDYDANKDKDDAEGPPVYRTGDYWLIPARTATGDIEWPQHRQAHAALPPHGVRHHYAPLAFITLDAKGMIQDAQSHDLRRRIKEAWEAMPLPTK